MGPRAELTASRALRAALLPWRAPVYLVILGALAWAGTVGWACFVLGFACGLDAAQAVVDKVLDG